MKVLIVDDEPASRRILREELEEFRASHRHWRSREWARGAAVIAELRPDLVFLDLQMPVMSGFEVAQSLCEPPLPILVVVTAFDQYAIAAFEAGAIDYLLKPVIPDWLRTTALERALRMMGKPGEIAARVEKVADPL